MAFPKPEYIQSFLDEKLKKSKKGEKTSLLNDDDLDRCRDQQPEESNYNRLTLKPLKQHRNTPGTSPPSSVFSESDDAGRNREYSSIEAEEKKRLRPKSVASDADCETDDSTDLHRRRTTLALAGSPSRKSHGKRGKDTKVPLKPNGVSNATYGGTSEVELDCAEALATYNPKDVKGIRKVGGNMSTNNKSFQDMSTTSNGETSKGFLRTKNGIERQEEYAEGKSYNYKHKHSSESSNSDFSPRSRRSSMESEHCHDSSDERSEKDKKKRRKAMKKLMIATALSFLFMVGEVVGGYLANSLAVMTDASHLLTDVSSFLISIIALKMASRPITKKMTFGWHRAEVIGAIVSVLAIWVVTGVLVYLAIMRLITNDYEVNGKNMLITAALAVGFNIVMGLVLHEHGHLHGHSHGHSHGENNHDHDHEAGSTASGRSEEDMMYRHIKQGYDYEASEEKCLVSWSIKNISHPNEFCCPLKDSNESGNVNVRAAFIHVIGDLLQSLGVLTAAFIIYFKPEYKIADPICTFVFSVLVLITTITILRDTVVIIMEGSPVNIKYNVVKEKLLEVDGVTAVHDLRIWSLTLNQTVMSAHLAIDKYADPSTILKRATRRLKALYEFHSLTLQVEYYSDDMDSCKKCQPA